AEPFRVPDLDAVYLAEQDGVLAEACPAHQCRWNRDASLRVHCHLASIHQERASERAAPTISHGNAAQPFLDVTPLVGTVERQTAFEAGDQSEGGAGLAAGGTAHRRGNADAALVIDRMRL